nr:PLP-dependent aminotransferase family protein [Halomonas hydrothermalis]
MYEKIADAVISDINSGKLRAGELLPPHRELAEELGISVGTISRAYKILVDKNFVEAGARRGTRVSKGLSHSPQSLKQGLSGHLPPHDLRGHLAAYSTWEAEVREAVAEIGRRQNIDDILNYQAITGREKHREAGAKWLEFTGNTESHVDEVVVFNGAQHALTCTLLATCSPGDIVATERLTYAGLRVAAPALGLRLLPLDIDDDGIIPEAFSEACNKHTIKALVCVPNMHNPTTNTMPLSRREEILEIAASNGLVVIEDDVYGGLMDKKIPSMFSISSDNVIRITGLSKTLGPGLRVGFAQAKQSIISSLSTSLRATSWMATPLMAEVATQLINSGRAEKALENNKAELYTRNKILSEALEGFNLSTARYGTHAWLKLPPAWTRSDFALWSQDSGIKTLMADAYIVGDATVDEATRISVSAARSEAALRDAAQRINSALKRPPEKSSTLL